MEQIIKNWINNIIDNKLLANELINNTEFILKYVDEVDDKFTDPIEKQIVYKQLLILTFSCLEGLIKETLIFIKEKCGKCDKVKKCEYYPGKNIKNLPFAKAIEKLFNMRVIYIYEHDLMDYDFIKELR